MKKIIIALLIVFFVIGGIQFYKKTKENEKKQEITKNEQNKENSLNDGSTLNEDNWNVRPNEFIENKNKPIKEAKDFTLENLSGEKVSYSSLKGKTVLINFWATWCPPCKIEMPDLNKLYEKYKDDKNLVILTINVGEDKNAVSEFIKQNNYKFPVLLDTNSNVALDYKAMYLPTTVLIDKDGKVADYRSGAMSLEQMEEFLNK